LKKNCQLEYITNIYFKLVHKRAYFGKETGAGAKYSFRAEVKLWAHRL